MFPLSLSAIFALSLTLFLSSAFDFIQKSADQPESTALSVLAVAVGLVVFVLLAKDALLGQIRPLLMRLTLPAVKLCPVRVADPKVEALRSETLRRKHHLAHRD